MALAMTLLAASSAQAAVYLLTLDGCTGGCGTAPYGTVTVTPDATDVGSLDVVINLAAGVQFNGAGNSPTHKAVAFDLVGNPVVTFKNISNANFVPNVPLATANDAPFGAFGYTLDWNGPNGNPTGVTALSFEVFTAGGPLTLGSTLYNGQSLVFAADVLGNGNTGNVAAVLSAVPEPATWAMLLVGFGLIGAGLRTRREENSVLAS